MWWGCFGRTKRRNHLALLCGLALAANAQHSWLFLRRSGLAGGYRGRRRIPCNRRFRLLGSGLAVAVLAVPGLIEFVEFVAPAQGLQACLSALKVLLVEVLGE